MASITCQSMNKDAFTCTEDYSPTSKAGLNQILWLLAHVLWSISWQVIFGEAKEALIAFHYGI